MDFCNSGNHPPFYAALTSTTPRTTTRPSTSGRCSRVTSRAAASRWSSTPRRATCSSAASADEPGRHFVMQGTLARSVTLPTSSPGDQRPLDPTWPHLYGVFDDDLKAVVDTWCCNHAVGVVASSPSG